MRQGWFKIKAILTFTPWKNQGNPIGCDNAIHPFWGTCGFRHRVLGSGSLGRQLEEIKRCQLLRQYHDRENGYAGRNTSIAKARLHSGSRLHGWRNQADTVYIRHARAIKIWPLDVKSKIQQKRCWKLPMGNKARVEGLDGGDDTNQYHVKLHLWPP